MRPRRRSRPWLPLWGSWRASGEPERAYAVANMGKCGDSCRVSSQSRPPPTIEPGDPQRCGSTARVADSSLPAGATRPLSHGFQPCQLSQRESQGAAAPPGCFPIGETTSAQCADSAIATLPGSTTERTFLDSPLQNLRPCDTLKKNLRKSGAYQ